MAWAGFCKLLQRQTYDVLSHRYGLLAVIVGLILLFVSAFQFGEVALEWSREKYVAVFNSFSDNVAGKSFQNRLCLPVPIDVVYTWVNGSDPRLLEQLKAVKLELEMELNITHSRASSQSTGCMFTHCIFNNMVAILPPLPGDLSQRSLSILYPALGKATSIQRLSGDHGNITLLKFDSHQDAEAVTKEKVMVDGKNASVNLAYLSSDWTLPSSILLSDKVIMTGFPKKYTQEELLEKIPEKHRNHITKVEQFDDGNIALLHMDSKKNMELLLEAKNITLEGKEASLNTASVVWDLSDTSHSEDISASRFADNEELRYSLRSIEKFAPWVRHVYIVTNGQIPSWLNLDCPRLSIITHKELFTNQSHLPTFSSPAIESHIHQIPGLSDKLIYMNDDVMFGKDVWPDDFYTHAYGQKVYLTWPVPNCQEGCPSSWILDGYCDKACNNSECEWDGGDCSGDKPSNTYGGGVGPWGQDTSNDILYCHSGCANNWMADRYCDQACNTYECAFDAGDCGVSSFRLLHRVDLRPSKTHYILPKGTYIAYFNLTDMLGKDGTVQEALYEDHDVLRSVAVAQKYRVMTLVLYKNHNSTTLPFSLTAKNASNDRIQFNFTVTVETHITKVTNVTVYNQTDVLAKPGKARNRTKEILSVFKDVPDELRGPKPVIDKSMMYLQLNLSDYQLGEQLHKQLEDLFKILQSGDLTLKGFYARQHVLWIHYLDYLYTNQKLAYKVDVETYDTSRLKTLLKPFVTPLNEQLLPGNNTFDSYLQTRQNVTYKIRRKKKKVPTATLR